MEFVYVVPRAELFPECYPQGLVRFGPDFSRADFEARVLRHGFYVERRRAECEPSWKQIIPYSVVVRDARVLLMKRLRKGSEGRLFDKLSIGVGGHVNPCDQPSQADLLPLDACTRRELDEELLIEGNYSITGAGILNDDANPVGAVHLGLVQVVALEGDARIREQDVLAGEFTSPAELAALLASGANFETWSRALVECIDELLAAAPPAMRAPPPRPIAASAPCSPYTVSTNASSARGARARSETA